MTDDSDRLTAAERKLNEHIRTSMYKDEQR